MIFAWREQYLDVDLTSGQIKPIALPRQILRKTIGGIGLAAQLIFDRLPATADPLSPQNVLAFVSGPLGGTTWPGSGRIVIAGRSPLTGLWGEASVGGYFGTHLKRAGFDAILVRGQAEKPVVLALVDGKIWLEDAGKLWGQETYDAEMQLQEKYPRSEVIAIGPAGERLAPMASLVHHKGNDVAARCGLGAVAGAKRLKGIVIRATGTTPVADEAAFKALKREAIERFNQNDFIQVIRMGGGTAAATPIAIEMADMPAKNWDLHINHWTKEAGKITGQSMQAQFPAKKDTCYACPVACKWNVNAQRPNGELNHLAGPEYESLVGLGSQNLINDPLSVIQSADLCNRLGIDTISVGATIAWAIEAYEKGILTDEHTNGLTLQWGDPELILELTRRIGMNQPGIGALLGMGSKRAAEAAGGGDEFAIQVKGLELPFHHPRALRGLEIAYATLPRGATHNEEGVTWDWEDSTYPAWIEEMIGHMDLSGANSSMVYCQFLAGALNANYTARLLTAATGDQFTPEDLLQAGERAWYLRRLFNLRLGVGLEADELPSRIVKQIAESAATLKDFDKGLAEFHRQRELDERGIPPPAKLKSLDLEEEGSSIMQEFLRADDG